MSMEKFDFNGNAVRVVVGEDGEPRWVASDVAKVLGFGHTPSMIRGLDDDEKGVHIVHTLGGDQEVAVINESGLYSVILRSRKPEAKEFKRWVTRDVLPSIRKRGAYMTEQTLERALNEPSFLIQLATKLKEEQEKRAEVEAQNVAMRPKALFADAVSMSETDILVGELAKILRGNGVDVGQNRMFAWLRENGFLISRKGSDWNMPTQKAMDLGLFRVKETVVSHSDGHTSISKTPKVTGKGQQYFVARFLEGEFNV